LVISLLYQIPERRGSLVKENIFADRDRALLESIKEMKKERPRGEVLQVCRGDSFNAS